MNVLPFQIHEVMSLNNRVAKIKSLRLLDTEKEELTDKLDISSEPRKKQVLSQAKEEVLERIREPN